MFTKRTSAYYDTSLMLTLKDVIPNNREFAKKFLIKTEDAPNGKLRDIYHSQCNSSLIRKIFNYTIRVILWEVAVGNCSFYWPHSKSKIFMGYLDDKVTRSKAEYGKLDYIDLLQTDYKIPYITFEFSPHLNKKPIKIYISRDMYEATINHANKGGKFSKRPRKLDYFLPHIYEEFKYIRPQSLRLMILDCFNKLLWHLKQGEEVRLLDAKSEIRFFRPLGKQHDSIMSSIVRNRINKAHKEKYEKFFI
jgi:hypothetical protein